MLNTKGPRRGSASMVCHANVDSGTLSATLPLTRSPGTVHSCCSVSISSHFIPATSPRRHPVSTISRTAAPCTPAVAHAKNNCATSPSSRARSRVLHPPHLHAVRGRGRDQVARQQPAEELRITPKVRLAMIGRWTAMSSTKAMMSQRLISRPERPRHFGSTSRANAHSSCREWPGAACGGGRSRKRSAWASTLSSAAGAALTVRDWQPGRCPARCRGGPPPPPPAPPPA